MDGADFTYKPTSRKGLTVKSWRGAVWASMSEQVPRPPTSGPPVHGWVARPPHWRTHFQLRLKLEMHWP